MDDNHSVFEFEGRPAASPLVEAVWRTRSLDDGSFVSTAETHWEMVISRHRGKLAITMRGPETQAKRAPFAKDTEYFGIVFKHGAYLPQRRNRPISQGQSSDHHSPGKNLLWRIDGQCFFEHNKSTSPNQGEGNDDDPGPETIF